MASTSKVKLENTPAPSKKPHVPTKPERLGPSAKRGGRGGGQRNRNAPYSNLLPILSKDSQPKQTPSKSWFQFLIDAISFTTGGGGEGVGANSPLTKQPFNLSALYIPLSHSIFVPPQLSLNSPTVIHPSDSAISLLWHRGFFGKGSLSRSDPTWAQRVSNSVAQVEGRKTDVKRTAEEVKDIRRKGRKEARKKRVEEKNKEREREGNTGGTETGAVGESPSGSGPKTPQVPGSDAMQNQGGDGLQSGAIDDPVSSTATKVAIEDDGPAPDTTITGQSSLPVSASPVVAPSSSGALGVPADSSLIPAEHLQLQLEEAFFLIFALGCLDVRIATGDEGLIVGRTSSSSTFDEISQSPSPLTIKQAWNLFRQPSPFPNPPKSNLFEDDKMNPYLTRPDSPFIISYAVYHHYRSLGWVVRSGVKFCADWVIYGSKGPVGGHAEFSILIIPTYLDPSEQRTSPFPHRLANGPSDSKSWDWKTGPPSQGQKNWTWFSTISRVTAGVKKTLILCYITIPSSKDCTPEKLERPEACLPLYTIREVVCKRWVAGRTRD